MNQGVEEWWLDVLEEEYWQAIEDHARAMVARDRAVEKAS